MIAGEDLVALSEARAAAILDAAGEEPGTMAAITAPVDGLRAALADASIEGVVVANHNAPDQAVISGATEAVSGALAALEARGLTGRPIPVACAFHSPVVAGASPERSRACNSSSALPQPSRWPACQPSPSVSRAHRWITPRKGCPDVSRTAPRTRASPIPR